MLTTGITIFLTQARLNTGTAQLCAKNVLGMVMEFLDGLDAVVVVEGPSSWNLVVLSLKNPI